MVLKKNGGTAILDKKNKLFFGNLQETRMRFLCTVGDGERPLRRRDIAVGLSWLCGVLCLWGIIVWDRLPG
jgi:hypothetical protein